MHEFLIFSQFFFTNIAIYLYHFHYNFNVLLVGYGKGHSDGHAS